MVEVCFGNAVVVVEAGVVGRDAEVRISFSGCCRVGHTVSIPTQSAILSQREFCVEVKVHS